MIKLDLEFNKSLEKKGVTFLDINLSFIEKGAKISKGVIIYPLTFIDKKTTIKEGAIIFSNVYLTASTIGKDVKIKQNSEIENSEIKDEAVVNNSVVLDSKVGERTKVGPFAYIRPGSDIGKDCKIGDFVEIKNTKFSDNSKASHLTYVGDATIGKHVNLGCGTVFVNYDGVNKHRSTVEDYVFVGCNSNIISPRKISKASFIAAGSTVNKDVPEGSLFIERGNSKIIKNFPLAKEILKKINEKNKTKNVSKKSNNKKIKNVVNKNSKKK